MSYDYFSTRTVLENSGNLYMTFHQFGQNLCHSDSNSLVITCTKMNMQWRLVKRRVPEGSIVVLLHEPT